MSQTVKEFVNDSYRLIQASNPTIPLRDGAMGEGVRRLNLLIQSYSDSGLLLPISSTISYPLVYGTREISFADAGTLPAPDIDIGRLIILENAWMVKENVTYPLMDLSRNIFRQNYLVEGLLSVPVYVIINQERDRAVMRLYPGASQTYELFILGKFTFLPVTQNSIMNLFPDYMNMFLQFALAKSIAFYSGRSSAWTPELENELSRLQKNIESVSSINLIMNQQGPIELNGAARALAGI